MNLTKSLSKTVVLLGSVVALAACGANTEETTTTVTESKMTEAATTMMETTEAATTMAMTTMAKSSDEMAASYKDGEYKLESDADERGWSHTFTIVVKDGRVTESNYDMVDAEGNLKSEDEEYNANMKKTSGISFADTVKALNEGLVEKQSTDLDAVSGATNTYNAFVEYAQMLLEAAAEGKTETIKVTVTSVNPS